MYTVKTIQRIVLNVTTNKSEEIQDGHGVSDFSMEAVQVSLEVKLHVNVLCRSIHKGYGYAKTAAGQISYKCLASSCSCIMCSYTCFSR